jgi:hypothetical protein
MQLPSLLGKKLGGEIYEKFSRLRGDEGPSFSMFSCYPCEKVRNIEGQLGWKKHV